MTNDRRDEQDLERMRIQHYEGISRENEKLECLNSNNPDDPCQGEVEYHSTGVGKAYPRCEKHWTKRLQIEDGINSRYPRFAPSNFDPDYAGERWDED